MNSDEISIEIPPLNKKLLKNKHVIKDKLEVATILCYKCSSYYNRIKNFIIIPTLLLSTISFILNNQNIEPAYLKIINSIVNGLTLGLVGIQSQLKVVENADNFKNHATTFQKLLHDLEAKESMENLNGEAITTIIQQYDVIISHLPNIPEHIKSDIRKMFGGKKHLPHICNGIEKIPDINASSVSLQEC